MDILFNAAGVLVHKPFLEQNDDDFDYIMETNYRAYVWTMQAFMLEIKNNKEAQKEMIDKYVCWDDWENRMILHTGQCIWVLMNPLLSQARIL